MSNGTEQTIIELTDLFPTTDKRVLYATVAAVTENFGVEDHDLVQDDGAVFRRAVQHLSEGFGERWQADHFLNVMTRDFAPTSVLEREERIAWGTTALVMQSFIAAIDYNEEEEEMPLGYEWAFDPNSVHQVVQPSDLIRRIEAVAATGRALSHNLHTLHSDLMGVALRSTLHNEPDQAPERARPRARL